MEFVDIAGLKIANTTLSDAAEYVASLAAGEKRGNAVVTPNAEIAAMALENEEFCALLNRSALAVADGIGVVKAAKIAGTPVKERVAGIDLATKVIEIAAKSGLSVYILGAKEGVAEKAANRLKARFDGFKICGFSNGYFDSDEDKIAEINRSGADIVMCGLGAPRQEKFIIENGEEFSAKVLMGVGGSIDVWAGNVKRAPKIFIRCRLEWLYRLLKQPSRFKRMTVIPKYLSRIKKIYRGKN